MRPPRNLTLLCALLAVAGCHRTTIVPETPMPPNTVLLSQMMRQLSARPGFTEGLLAQLEKGGKKSPMPMTPKLIDELRQRILGKDWQGLDRFPGWTMRAINPTLNIVTDVASHVVATHDQISQYLDLGPYALDSSQIVFLNEPSTLPGFPTEEVMTPLGDGVIHGDGPSPLAAEHAESQRLADVLNRLSANSLDGVQPLTATLGVPHPRPAASSPGRVGSGATEPEHLIALLQQTGHTITVNDARYFANFAHLHYNGQDVMAPFWIDSQIVIPHSGGRHLLIPAVHAEYEWHIRGPIVNADISYYYGDDGKSEWRTMDLLDQPWVLERNAHTYTGAQAVEVTRLAGLLTVAYMHQHARRPQLPFGGYYTLGVCQDGIAAIEQKMTGKSTLFPNTADMRFFDDPRDAEVNAMLAAIPKDRDGKPPEPERVFGSLPVAPQDFHTVTIPGLADDLIATYDAWQKGDPLQRSSEWLLAILLGVLAVFTRWYTRRHPRPASGQATKL